MEPLEITSPQALQARIAQGGVITVTRGTFATPIAHMNDCPSLKAIRIPAPHTRYWWTPDFGTAATTLGARKCEHCLSPRRYRPPFRPVR
jgi:hypothetical protein